MQVESQMGWRSPLSQIDISKCSRSSSLLIFCLDNSLTEFPFWRRKFGFRPCVEGQPTISKAADKDPCSYRVEWYFQ